MRVIGTILDIGKGEPSFLIVSLRYLGDVLVTTPLAVSIKTHIPHARVEYLVFEGTEAVLAKNPYVDKVNTIPRGTRAPRHALALFKKFDYAIAANPSDRVSIFAALSGKKSLGFTYYQRKEWWKRFVLDHLCWYDDRKHAVRLLLSILEPLGIPQVATVTMGFDSEDIQFAQARLPRSGYVILHPYSRGAYKYWHPAHWGKLVELIQGQTSLIPVFTITSDPKDRELLDEILRQTPNGCVSFPEPFSLSQMAAAIKGSVAYVGIDTAITHIAAAVGAPTIALYGPTWTRYWAPWPNGCTEESPFIANQGIQRKGNVTIIQKDWECVPCNGMACRISKRDRIECLEELSAVEVFTILRGEITKEQ